MNWYNDNDPHNAAWLRELIAQGQIPQGVVDDRSILDVRADELLGFTQCHFFAGIGGWSLALELAGWPANVPVYTCSCPCQPFSSVGAGLGEQDERHLWPVARALFEQLRPSVIIGEQVASEAGRDWLSRVRADLEAMAYAVGAADLCAASVGLPHIRQRLWWVADSGSQRFALHERRSGHARPAGQQIAAASLAVDGVQRRIPVPGFCPVVDGLSSIPFAVRGYGNAIVPGVGAEFITAFLEARSLAE